MSINETVSKYFPGFLLSAMIYILVDKNVPKQILSFTDCERTRLVAAGASFAAVAVCSSVKIPMF